MKKKNVFFATFFVAVFFMTFSVENVEAAGTCSGVGETCKAVTRDPSLTVTGFRSPEGNECTFRGTCSGSLTGTGLVEACCKSITAAPPATPPVVPTASGNCDPNDKTQFCNPLAFDNVEDFLGGILSAIQKIIVVLALVFIMIGAVMILASAGSSGMVEQGKGAITMALVGLALGVAAPSLLKELSNIIGWGQGSAIEALTLSEIAVNVLNFLLGTMGILALVMLVVGAIMYLTSAGDEDRIEKGKEIFKYSLIGVILAMSSMVLVTQIARFFTTTTSPSTATNASGGGALAAPSTCPVGDFSCIGGGVFGSVTQANCTEYQVGSVVNANGTNCCSGNDYACLDT